jgi:hypothetical protein
MIKTAEWALNGTPIFGPDAVTYQETPTMGIRLDGAAQRQGTTALEWRYQVLPIAELSSLIAIWTATYPVTVVRWLTPKGDWVDTPWCMQQPQIGRRSGYHAYDIVIRFTPVVYTGSGMTTSTGSTPTIYPGFDVPNPPPVARITHSAAVIGDPQIVVNVDGSGSTDADGAVVSYAWTDNSAAFVSLTGYPTFETPHEFTTPSAVFVYPYMSGMPDPIITLTVTDNAGQPGTATITVPVAALLRDLPTKGKRIVLASSGAAYVSVNGGLDFTPIGSLSGVTAVAGAGGFIIIGTDSGDVYIAANDSATATKVFTMTAAVADIAVAPRATSSVAVLAVDGTLAISTSSGQAFADAYSPLVFGSSCAWNQDVANELGVVGDIVAYTRNGGLLWTVDTSGLPGGSWTSSQRDVRIRYAGGSPGLYAATGAAWVATAVTGAVTAISEGHNDLCVAAGTTVYHVGETDIISSVDIAKTTHRIARDPTSTTLAMLATSGGLCKTLDNFATVGVLAFEGTPVTDVDFLREGGAGGADILLPVAGTVDVAGVWLYTVGIGWVRKNGATLPSSIGFIKVVADPFNRDRWAALGSAPAGGYVYTAGGVICAGTESAPLSPLWLTEDAGATWVPVVLTMQSHIGHGDLGSTLDWTTVEITDMEFDRRGVRGLFVFGSATVPEPLNNRHGMVWVGTGAALYASMLQSGTAVYTTELYYSYASNETESFSSAEGGPDGGIVAVTSNRGGFGAGAQNTIVYTDPANSVVSKNPGGVELDAGVTCVMERRPTFGSFAVVFAFYDPDAQQFVVYGTPVYTATPATLLLRVSGRCRAGGLTVVDGVEVGGAVHLSITYAIDELYCGGGQGVVSYVDAFSSEASETYRPDIFFTEVRCDRQWRRVVAAMAYVEKTIHVKTASGWATVPLPSGVLIHTGAGMEVLGI